MSKCKSKSAAVALRNDVVPRAPIDARSDTDGVERAGSKSMFQRIQQYPLIGAEGRWYRPRAYGDPQPDGRWQGWLIFFPLMGDGAIAPPHPETTQSTWTALTTWAEGLTLVYVEGALERSLTVAQQPSALTSRLAAAEYEALEDAERLETAAEMQRAAADLDEDAADIARDEADRIRRERLATESAMAATEEVAANVEAAIHEEAAREARDAAAEAAQRRRLAGSSAANPAVKKKRRATKRG